VDQSFERLITEGKLMTIQHNGFWACMDAFKERQQLEDLWPRETLPGICGVKIPD
jgi:glucose-1-phosphate cytidylyltransferase